MKANFCPPFFIGLFDLHFSDVWVYFCFVLYLHIHLCLCVFGWYGWSIWLSEFEPYWNRPFSSGTQSGQLVWNGGRRAASWQCVCVCVCLGKRAGRECLVLMDHMVDKAWNGETVAIDPALRPMLRSFGTNAHTDPSSSVLKYHAMTF